MSYQVFARKYRPQTFADVVGQEHITQTLRNAIEQNRLAHAYLFVGPRGTGKTSTARIVAKALNCTNGPNADFDPADDICVEIAEGRCMDVLEIDGASNNNVDQIRELRDNVRFAPTRGKYKVYIIDEVHMLTQQAFNALLKTLEEPPAHVKFIFATTEPQKVLPTILSRCQRFDLRRIPANLIAGHLQYIAGLEGITLEDAAAQSIAKGAEGGLRDAESMLDQLVAFCGDSITEPDVLAVFGFTGQQTVADLCGAILSTETAPALEIIHDQNEAGKDLMKLLDDLIGYLRNLLIFQVDPSGLDSEIPADVRGAMETHATHIPPSRLLELIDQFAATEGRMKWAPNKKLHFEIAVIKAVQTLDETTLTDVINALKTISEGGIPEVDTQAERLSHKPIASRTEPVTARSLPPRKPTPRPQPTPQAEATAPPVVPAPSPTPTQAPAQAPAQVTAQPTPEPEPVFDPEPAPTPAPATRNEEPVPSPPAPTQPAPATKVEEPASAPAKALDGHAIWANVQVHLREKPMTHAYLIKGEFIEVTGKTFLVGFPPADSMACTSLMEDDRRTQVETELKQITGTALQFKCETREGIVVTSIHKEELEEKIDPLAEFKNDRLIKEALEIFKGELEGPK